MIVWLASYPRSGNSFFRAVLWSAYGQRSGSMYPTEPSRHPVLRKLAMPVDPADLAELRRSDRPAFVKTHRLQESGDDSPAVVLVRDGRDAVASHARFAIAQGASGFERRSVEEAIEILISPREGVETGSWSESVRAWSGRAAPTAIVRFEELIVSPVESVRSAIESLGVALPEAKGGAPAFEELRAEDPALFPRGEVGAWRSELSPELEDRFWRLHGAEMLLLGYSRWHPTVPEPVPA